MEIQRKYSQESEQEAVQLTRPAAGNLTQVTRDLGITSGMLGRWCREAQQWSRQASPGTSMPHDQELARLKRDLPHGKRYQDSTLSHHVFSPDVVSAAPSPTE